MKRRSLLQLSAAALAAGPLAATAGAATSATSSAPWVLILRTRIAGHNYHNGPELMPRLGAGQPLELVREATNPHDPDAIRLDWHGQSIGYLPRQHNYAPARLLDEGQELSATIQSLDSQQDPWRPVVVDIHLLPARPGTGNPEQ